MVCNGKMRRKKRMIILDILFIEVSLNTTNFGETANKKAEEICHSSAYSEIYYLFFRAQMNSL